MALMTLCLRNVSRKLCHGAMAFLSESMLQSIVREVKVAKGLDKADTAGREKWYTQHI
jgi:hypothetical protein